MAANQVEGQFLTATVDISTATNTTIVTGVANSRVEVYAYQLALTVGTSATFLFDSSAGTALTGVFDLQGIYTSPDRGGRALFSTAAGTGLRITTTTGGSVSVKGYVIYRVVLK